MKKIHILGVAVVAMLAFGVVGAVSASAATLQWLANGNKIAAALASETKGELLLQSDNGGGLGIHVGVLCSGIFVGTVGPGPEDNISELLTLGLVRVTLAAPILNCVVDENCTEPEVSAVNLPWLTRLELMGTEAEPLFLDVLENGGQGNPGWEVTCLLLGTTITEICISAAAGANLTNDPTEKDVLAVFEEGTTADCNIGGAGTGLVLTDSTDEPGLITLNNGEALSVSYE